MNDNTTQARLPFGDADIARLGRMGLMEVEDSHLFANPPREIQERYVGASYENAYAAAAQFLNYLFEQVEAHSSRGLAGMRILDFGCGWGRMLRLIRSRPELNDIELHGCDLNRDMLEICRRSIPRVYLTPSDPFPPLQYRSGNFDVIYANSVFSHLGERNHLSWAQEYARILKPGGLVILTTQAKHFLEFCSDLRTGKRPVESEWHKSLAESYTEAELAARYDAGEMLYAPNFQGSRPWVYGEAIVPRAFFENHWGNLGFDLLEWWEHRDILGQNRVVLRRKSA